jgi:hypothetical protein
VAAAAGCPQGDTDWRLGLDAALARVTALWRIQIYDYPRKGTRSNKILTSTNRMGFTQRSEGLLSVEMSATHLLLIGKGWEKERWRRLARQREVG